MASKIRNYKNNKEKIEQIFKAYLICKFKIENNFVSGEELQKSMLFYKQVEFILSNIGDDAQYLKDAFINKKR
jgi:hypothetical protein